MKRKIDIVLGLGWGDEGKGKTVDWLCSQSNNPLVVRFSGGQQCGHTVMNQFGKHIHASFPSGALRGCYGYITKDCVVSPLHMFNEWEVLKDNVGYDKPRLSVHPLCPVTTPYEVGSNRATEKDNKHGSCGMGVGATMQRENTTPHKLRVIDLLNDFVFENKMSELRHYYDFKQCWYDECVEDHEKFLDAVKWFRENISVNTGNYLHMENHLIFEGSQGIMLDKDFGVFPHVTYANTTSKNVWQYISKKYDDITKHYVTRAYATRHGNGPFLSGEGDITLRNTEEEINVTNEWQGDFRVAPLDVSLLQHAIDCDESVSPVCASNIYVNGLDQINYESAEKVVDTVRKTLNVANIFKSYHPRTNYEL